VRHGGFTVWRVSSSDARFESYYRLHPDRLPDVILAPYHFDFTAYNNYDVSPTGEIGARDSYLAAYIGENDFDVHIVGDFGVVFCKRP